MMVFFLTFFAVFFFFGGLVEGVVENIGEGTFRNMDESQTKTAAIVSKMLEAFPSGCRFLRFRGSW